MVGRRVAKRSIERKARGRTAALLSQTGEGLRKAGVVSGFQVSTEPGWVTAAYKISGRPRTVEVRISPEPEDEALGVLVATLVDNYGDFVAGITGPTSIAHDFSPEDLKTELVESLLRHSIANLPGTVNLKSRMEDSWGGMFIAALDAREKAEVVYEMIKKERNLGNRPLAKRQREKLRPVAAAS